MIDQIYTAYILVVGPDFFYTLMAFVILATLFDAIFEKYLP